jgi:hypothetical protein
MESSYRGFISKSPGLPDLAITVRLSWTKTRLKSNSLGDRLWSPSRSARNDRGVSRRRPVF